MTRKIAHVIPALVKGGAERAAVDLANWQLANGFEVTMIVGWEVDEGLLRRELNPAIMVEYVGRGGVSRYAQALIWALRRRDWFDEFDVVHLHLAYAAVIGTLLHAMRRRRSPIIVETYHAAGMPVPARHRWVHRQLARARDAIVFMADDPRWRQFREARPYPRAALISNGLADPHCLKRSSPRGLAYRQRSGIPDHCPLVVGTISRLVRERRPDQILSVFAATAAQCNGDVHFLFVGAGPEQSRLEDIAREFGLGDRVHFPGLAIDPAEPLSQLDVYVTLNVGATSGLAGIQAVMCGVPTVALQLDAAHTSGEQDWIWSSTDPNAVGGQVVRLLANRTARVWLASRQRAFARDRFSIDGMGQSYSRLYSDLTHKTRRAC